MDEFANVLLQPTHCDKARRSDPPLLLILGLKVYRRAEFLYLSDPVISWALYGVARCFTCIFSTQSTVLLLLYFDHFVLVMSCHDIMSFGQARKYTKHANTQHSRSLSAEIILCDHLEPRSLETVPSAAKRQKNGIDSSFTLMQSK